MTLLLSNLKLIFRAAVRLKFLIATNLAINKIILVNLTINRKVKPDNMCQLSSKAQFISLKSRNLILDAISNAGFEVTVIRGPASYLSTQVC